MRIFNNFFITIEKAYGGVNTSHIRLSVMSVKNKILQVEKFFVEQIQ
jgi:hypothetical protein